MRSKAHASSARKSPVKSKTSAAKPAPAMAAPARRSGAGLGGFASSREAMLARVESVRLAQRKEGNFDCFGRAGQGYCDRGDCSYHDECLSISRMLHEA